MERNWLIRTSQNQILGPVSKEKIVEFIKKGALGLTDEISSGNGYWFYLKEKNLLDRYIFGDVPQSYNPISEAKTVLAAKEKPNLTSSINVSPANLKAPAHLPSNEEVQLPHSEDLDFPDITTVIKVDNIKTQAPKSEDLEYPDMSNNGAQASEFDDHTIVHQTNFKPNKSNIKFELPKEYQAKRKEEVAEVIALPADDDLAFPTLSDFKVDHTVTKINPEEDLDLNKNFTRTVALKPSQKEEVLTLETQTRDVARKTITSEPSRNSDKKLLHDRKPKVLPKKNMENLRDPNREQAYKHKEEPKRNDSYLFFVLILLILIIGSVLYYFKEILNKPLPV